MGRLVGTAVTGRAARSGSLTVRLFGPGMTALHKAGAAGLWMTLEALEKDDRALRKLDAAGGSWERADDAVTLSWDREPKGFFEALFEEAFRVDRSGLLWLPALGEPTQHPGQAVVLQEAMLETFLQHGKTRKADRSQDPQGNIAVEIDGRHIPLRFRRITAYAHRDPDFSPSASNALAGWLFPGGAVRHVGLGQATAMEEAPERALALRFALAGALYFAIRSRRGGVRPRYAIVLPEIGSLSRYARIRRSFLRFGVAQLHAAGTAEAGFRVLAELEAAGLLDDLRVASCRVVSFGIVPWSQQQKTRVEVFAVQPHSADALRVYRLCHQFLTPRLVSPEGRAPFWDVPEVPDMAARNLTEGRPWWAGFADLVAEEDRRNHVFRWEKEGLAKMVDHPEALPEGPERIFVSACHEAWRRRMGQLGERARREQRSFTDLVNREFERRRVGFSRCKNAASLRAEVTDFWSRSGGALPALREGWRDVLTLLDDRNWRKGKDLALLALASYRPESKAEEEAMAGTETAPEEEATA